MTASGRRIGAWVLEHPLGAGGGARSWAAHHADRPAERVAVRLLPAPPDPHARERFAAEADAFCALDHPAVVACRGHGGDDAACWLVMDLVEGVDLAARLAEGPLSPGEARRVFRDVSAGLAHAHAHAVFHRDLRPGSVRLRPDGAAVVVGFASSLDDGRARLTSEGLRPAHLVRLPPEVFDHDGHADPRQADIYALGVLLYEALEGRPAVPVDAALSSQQQSVRVIADKLERPRLRLSPGAPPDLADLVEVATHPDPSRRLPSMALFHERLGGAPSPEAVAAGQAVGWTAHGEGAPPEPPPLPPPPPEPLAPAPDPALELDHPAPAAAASPPPGPAPEGGAARPSLRPVLALAGLLILAVLVGLGWLLSGDDGVSEAPVPLPPVRTSIAVHVPGPVDRVTAGDAPATREADAWVAELLPGAHEVVLGVGEGCGDEAPLACGPCCACARHPLEVGADPVRVSLEPPGAPPPVVRELRVRVVEAPPDVPVVVSVDGAAATATEGAFTATAASGDRASVRVDVGACPEPAVGCAITGACPQGCWSTVRPVDVTCGTEPQDVEVAVEGFVPLPPPPPARRSPTGSPAPGRAPGAPLDTAMHVRVVGERLAGALDPDALQAAVERLSGRAELCWRRSDPPWRTMDPAAIVFRVRGDGSVDPTSAEIERGTGDNLLDACLRAAVRDGGMPGLRAGRGRATFHLTVE